MTINETGDHTLWPAGPIKAKYVEKEHAIVDGVDISGHWNRMFEQRVITEYTPELIEKIADHPRRGIICELLSVRQVCRRLPCGCGRELRSAQAVSLCPNRHGLDRSARTLAVHHLRQLPARVPQRSEHGQDHARRARAGHSRGQVCPCRITAGIREHRQDRQSARTASAQTRRVDSKRRRGCADHQRLGSPCGCALVCRFVSFVSSARH